MTIEVTAKKVDDAISQGLKQLGASLDEVNVEVVDSGGLFRKAKVKLTLERPDSVKEQPDEKQEARPAKTEKSAPTAVKKEEVKKPTEEKSVKADAEPKKQDNKKSENRPANKESNMAAAGAAKEVKQPKRVDNAPRKKTDEDIAAEKKAAEFIKEIVAKMGFVDATVAADETNDMIEITAPAGDDSLLIGRHGETLSALSYIAETCARAEKCHINITVDCNGYRERRAASLTAMAKRRANECAAKHRKIKLEAMERVDRRTIHNALTEDDRVTTASEGKEPYRYVVILPKKTEK